MSNSTESTRYDRAPLAFRKMSCELGFLNEADGSARYCIGDTEVISAVYGPAQPKFMRSEDPEGLALEVSYSTTAASVTGATGANEALVALNSDVAAPSSAQQRMERSGSRSLHAVLKQCIAVDKFPRQSLLVQVTVVRDDGGALAAAMVACSLALLNAGVPLLHVPLAATVALLPLQGQGQGQGQAGGQAAQLLLDPCLHEQQQACSTHVYMARLPSAPGAGAGVNDAEATAVILHSSVVGACSPVQLVQAQACALQATGQVLQFVRAAVAQM